MAEFAEFGRPGEVSYAETSFIHPSDDVAFDVADDILADATGGILTDVATDVVGGNTRAAPDATPSWAVSSVPSGISRQQLADENQTRALLDRWGRERGEVQQNLEIVSSTEGERWLRWGSEWLLLTNKNSPGEFLKPSTLKSYYGADVTKALGVYKSTGLSRQAAADLNRADQELGKASESMDTVELQDLGQGASEAIANAEKIITVLTREGLTSRDILGMCRALERSRGEHTNNLAKLTELDKHIALEERKLKEAPDEATKNLIAERLRKLQDERAARLEAASTTRKALRSQINRIRETLHRILHEDKTLAERIKTLFREQGITIASILTALGMAISTLVLALTGGSGGGAAPPQPTPPQPPGKGGVKRWLKKHLQSLGRVLAKLAGKAAAALPGIIGSIVSGSCPSSGKPRSGWLVICGPFFWLSGAYCLWRRASGFYPRNQSRPRPMAILPTTRAAFSSRGPRGQLWPPPLQPHTARLHTQLLSKTNFHPHFSYLCPLNQNANSSPIYFLL